MSTFLLLPCLKTNLQLFLRPFLQTDLLKMLNCFSTFLKSFFRQRSIFSGINYPVELLPKAEFHSTQSALSHPRCGLEKEPEKQI